MEKYRVQVREILSRTIEVYASDDEEAEKKVINMYQNEEVVLDSNDLEETSFDAESCYEDLTDHQIDVIYNKVKSLPKSKESELISFTEDDVIYTIYVNSNRSFVSSVTVTENGIDKHIMWTSRFKINNLLTTKVFSYPESEIRRCDHCGKPMDKGYYLGGEFACSDACALALYDGDKKQMEEDLSHAEEPNGECYWTEWDDVYLD